MAESGLKETIEGLDKLKFAVVLMIVLTLNIWRLQKFSRLCSASSKPYRSSLG
jgi:hypothetical protein